jgi:hypothetical protein
MKGEGYLKMFDNFRLPVFITWTIKKNCTSNKMEHHHILPFLFVRDCTAFCLFGARAGHELTEWPQSDFLL